MSKQVIPEKWENESVAAFMRRLLDLFPKMSPSVARSIATQTTRMRSSKYRPHYGDKAGLRNLRHAINCTHGLKIQNNHIVFG